MCKYNHLTWYSSYIDIVSFQVDSNAKNIRGKSWPFFDSWTEVFGKDRATGSIAEDVMDAVNDLIIEDNLNHVEVGSEEVAADPAPQPIPLTTDTEDSEASSKRHEAGTSKLSRKRKQADNIDKTLCELLTQMQRDTNSRLESISHRIGYQSDLGQARREVWAMLEVIPDLSLDAIFDAADVLIGNPQKLEFFSGLPVPVRPAYVRRLLDGKGT